jgi:hypothetical protein
MQSSTEAPDRPFRFSLGLLDPAAAAGFPVTITALGLRLKAYG